MITGPKIAIIGAGPAGLTLASLLSKAFPFLNYTLYDLRPSPSSSHSPTSPVLPSGSLDLHPESGLLALESCGLLSAFENTKRKGSEETILADKHAAVRWADDGMGGNCPEIARNDLLHLLAGSVPAERVEWKTKILSVTTSSETQKHVLQFSGKESEEFDVVIGTDGAWSRVRHLVTEVQPHFSGINCVTLTIPSISSNPSLSAFIGQGSYYAAGDHKAIIAQRGSLDSARVYLMIQSESSDYLSISGISSASQKELEKLMLEEETLFSTWAPDLRSLITAGCYSSVPPTSNPLSMLPVGHKFPHTPGLTLLGDAAHLMTPFAGEGVNAAMRDALELSQALTSSLENLDEAIKKFEEEMFKRMKPISEETMENLGAIFAADSPDGFVKIMQSHGLPPEDA